jgi:hypothetical protein
MNYAMKFGKLMPEACTAYFNVLSSVCLPYKVLSLQNLPSTTMFHIICSPHKYVLWNVFLTVVFVLSVQCVFY